MVDVKESEQAAENVEEPKKPCDLTDIERRLIDAVQNNNITTAEQLLKEGNLRIDCLDEYGSTPLQLAAFRGRIEMCQLLLQYGADVNSNEHEHGYTTLMFAALSGNANLCRILLEAGAKTHVTNRLNRTASEMGAFTGQHHCVSVINNFLAIDDVECYTKPRGTETEARLPLNLAGPLHKLTLTYNVNPVKTILFLHENEEFLLIEKKILYIIEDLMERQMKRKDANEIMAFKLHVILGTMKACFKAINDPKGDKAKTPKEKLILYAKSLLATKDTNFPIGLELLLRQIIKEYPYHHSVLFQQMVRTLSKTAIGNDPTAASVVQQTLIGQRMMTDESFCTTCGGAPAAKRCGACKMVNYCGSECQKLHWFAHKRWCPTLAKEYEDLRAASEKMRLESSQPETGGGVENDENKPLKNTEATNNQPVDKPEKPASESIPQA